MGGMGGMPPMGGMPYHPGMTMGMRPMSPPPMHAAAMTQMTGQNLLQQENSEIKQLLVHKQSSNTVRKAVCLLLLHPSHSTLPPVLGSCRSL